MKSLIAIVVFASCLPSAAASSVQTRLERADSVSNAAIRQTSPERASAASLSVLEGGEFSAMTAVDARGHREASVPSLTVAPSRRVKAAVPSPSAASSGYDDDHAGLLMVSGFLAPAVGAIAGALVAGGPGAIVGALIGLAVGVVLFAVGLGRALRRIFNP